MLTPVVPLLGESPFRTVSAPRPQDLFFKYTWNNFLHFQVELCIAAVLSHAVREDRAEACEPEGGAEPLPGNRGSETPQAAAAPPENTMVTHVSLASVWHVAACCMPSPTQTMWSLALRQAF